MENAADALKMAAAMLVFIIAIASSFSLFGKAKETADSIVTMRDRQAYLTSEDVGGGILYTSTEDIEDGEEAEVNNKFKVTTNGDRIVSPDDVVATITRYSKEKYGVTVVRTDGTVIARFDSNTENIVRQWNNISAGLDDYIIKLNENTKTFYAAPIFSKTALESIYAVTGNSKVKCGAPWYGNEDEIRKRISCELSGELYSFNGLSFERAEGLLAILNSATRIVEITNEIDQSTYLKDGAEDTNLLQQYEMPTIEIIYIIS